MPEAGTVHAGGRRRPSSSPPRTLQGVPVHPTPVAGVQRPGHCPEWRGWLRLAVPKPAGPDGRSAACGRPMPRWSTAPDAATTTRAPHRRAPHRRAPPATSLAVRRPRPARCRPAPADRSGEASLLPSNGAPSTTLPALRRRSLIPVPADSARRPAPGRGVVVRSSPPHHTLPPRGHRRSGGCGRQGASA